MILSTTASNPNIRSGSYAVSQARRACQPIHFGQSALSESQPMQVKGRYRNAGEGHPFKHQADALRIAWKTLMGNVKRLLRISPAYGAVPCQTLAPYLSNVNGLSTHWIGHATSLVQMNGFNILTDPVFGNLGGLYSRKSKPGILPGDLPPINALVISHTHRDHLDIPSLKQLLRVGALKPDTLVIAPAGTQKLLTRLGLRNVQGFDGWWRTFSLQNTDGETLSVTPVPARHWSGRNCLDTNKSPWAGFMLQSGEKTAYYAGDTAYDERYFQEIKDHFPKIDLALMPIGPCEPRKLMKGSHMGPVEAVEALKILKPGTATAIHYGTYGLGPDTYRKPVDLLNQTWRTAKASPELQNTRLESLPIGGRLDL